MSEVTMTILFIAFIVVCLIWGWTHPDSRRVIPTSKRTYLYSNDDPIIPKGWMDTPIDPGEFDNFKS